MILTNKEEINYSISEYFFGENDGEKEAIYNKDFVKYFYTGKGYQNQLDNMKYWLILGRKGTGKSILGWYFHENIKSSSNKFCDIISYRDFKYNLLLELEDNDIKPNQYISIWKFTLFIYLGKLLLNNEDLKGSAEYSKLEDFIGSNFSLDLNQNKILELAIRKGIKGNICGIGGEGQKKIRYENGSYLNYLESLEQTIMSLLNQNKSKYFLVLDDLDDRFRRNKNNKDALISLIKAVNYINLFLAKAGHESKIITLLRTDIFSYLNDPDLNKIKSVNGVIINWGNTANKNSDLFKMLAHKVKASQGSLEKYTDNEIFDILFPESIQYYKSTGEKMYTKPEKFFLERTFFRPRDIISYLKVIVSQYSNTKNIGHKEFKEGEREYSNYLLSEIENELSGHFDDDYIKECFKLLKQFKKNKFTYSELDMFIQKHKKQFLNIEIEIVLNLFFEFGVIANTWQYGRNTYYSTVIRDDKAEIDYSKEFVLHLGLRKAILY